MMSNQIAQPAIQNDGVPELEYVPIHTSIAATSFSSGALPIVVHIGMSPGMGHFEITVNDNTPVSSVIEVTVPPPPHLGRVKAVFNEVADNKFTIAFKEGGAAANEPSLLVQVDTLSNGSSQTDGTQNYALIEMEGFQSNEFPIRVTLLGPPDMPSYEAFGTVSTMLVSGFPLTSLNGMVVQFDGVQSPSGPTAVEVVGVGFPPDGYAERRIRVILQQAVIDPPPVL